MFDLTDYINDYLKETNLITGRIDCKKIKDIFSILENTERIFFIGLGGGAGTGSHAAGDFNKIAGISTFCLSDNASLVLALLNDEGADAIFWRQLAMHRLAQNDCLFIFSVGGGSQQVSPSIVKAIEYAKAVGAKIVGVVGRDSGATYQQADVCILVPSIELAKITPHTEDWQMIITHLLANALKEAKNL